MAAWIELNGVKSTAFDGVTVEAVTPFVLAQRKAARAAVSGRFGGVEQGAPTFDAGYVSVKLLVRGADRTETMSRTNALSKWLAGGEKLRLWFDPGRYCLGRIDDGVNADRVSARFVRLSFRFTVSPPCFLKVKSAQSGWEPNDTAPIPEQLTDQTATAKGTFTAPGRLPAVTDSGAFQPLMYFSVTGTWAQVSIGSLVITRANTTSGTVYIDCDEQVVYALDAGQRVNVPATGAFPEYDAAGIQVGGTDMSVTVRLLMIERG